MPPDNILFPLGQVIELRPLPANPPPELLLTQFAEHRAKRFVARALPPCFRLRIGGIPRALPAPGSWVIWSVDVKVAEGSEIVMLGLSEAEAQQRVEELNTARCATGYHRWS